MAVICFSVLFLGWYVLETHYLIYRFDAKLQATKVIYHKKDRSIRVKDNFAPVNILN